MTGIESAPVELSEDVWDRWEAELRESHRLFIGADAKAKEAIAIAERWYA